MDCVMETELYFASTTLRSVIQVRKELVPPPVHDTLLHLSLVVSAELQRVPATGQLSVGASDGASWRPIAVVTSFAGVALLTDL